MARQIPKRLGKDTIVEVIWEIRFAGGTHIAEILPGVVYQKLKDEIPNNELNVEKLPPSQLPGEILENDPSLRYASQVKLSAADYSVQIGNRVASVRFERPYPGWTDVHARILKVAEILNSTNMLGEIERFSLKYIDVIPDEAAPTLDGLDVELKIGGISLNDKTTNVRAEIPEGEFLHILQIGRPIVVTSNATRDSFEGMLVDIDTIATHQGRDFWAGFPNALGRAHDSSKLFFFKLLTLDTETKLEPEYQEG